MDLVIDLRLKPLDVGILVLHIEFEVMATEHNSTIK